MLCSHYNLRYYVKDLNKQHTQNVFGNENFIIQPKKLFNLIG